MANDTTISWQDLNLAEDEALAVIDPKSTTGTIKSLLRPTLPSLFQAHDLILYEADAWDQDLAKGEKAREDHQEDNKDDQIPDTPIERPDLSPRPQKKPLKWP